MLITNFKIRALFSELTNRIHHMYTRISHTIVTRGVRKQWNPQGILLFIRLIGSNRGKYSREESVKTPSPKSYHTQLLRALFVLWFTLALTAGSVEAQSIAERLKQGVDSPEQSQNEFRGGSDQRDENMKKLFAPIMSSAGGGIDKWYSPHLRDLRINKSNRKKQAKLRSDAGVTYKKWGPCPFLPGIEGWICSNGKNIRTACTECQPRGSHPPNRDGQRPMQGCPAQDLVDEHVYDVCCDTAPTGTRVYESFIEDSNYKTCCVKQDEAEKAEEYIACKHPMGDGWAGLFEYYYPTNALGWENERTTTMIAKKDEVKSCVDAVDSIMENDTTADWVSKAIERNQKMAAGESPQVVSGSEVKGNVKKDIKEVRPQDKKLRFSDSLQGEGLTLRINFPSMEQSERHAIAKHFCMRPEQFDKLLDPVHDKLQFKGGASKSQLEQIPIWSNYCKMGVELMTDTAKSKIVNWDRTKTDFTKGMSAWEQDPLYCQRINSRANPNMGITKIKDVIDKSQGAGRTASEVGYTCSAQGKLNGGMVPVSLYRHAAVESRAAISDHALGFLIAGGLAESVGMRQGQRSYYKRFEPLPYSWGGSESHRTFKGKQFTASGTNELQLVDPGNSNCKGYSGNNYQGRDTSDQLYISNFTHKVFTQEAIVNVDTEDAFDKFVQEWATEAEKKNIAKRGVDKEVHNYAAAFRKFATCPKGFVRWRPPNDEHNMNLVANLDTFCGEENFGSPRAH